MRSLSLIVIGGCFALLFFLSSLLFTSHYSPLTLYAIAVLPLITRLNLRTTNNTIKYMIFLSFITTFAFVLPLDVDASTWFGIFYDRNVFGLIMLPFFFALSRHYRYGIVISIVLAVMLGSRNVLLAVLIERILSNLKVFKFLYIKFPMTSKIFFILSPILGLVLLYVFSENINFAYDREYLSIFDASNLARATGMMDAIKFLYSNFSVFIFGNGWHDYLMLDVIHAHNDFVRWIIKHGIFVFFYFSFFIFKAYKYYQIDGSIVLSYIIFSGILGGVGWGFGYYWLIMSIFLFSPRKSTAWGVTE
jgi:hypothetical protein